MSLHELKKICVVVAEANDRIISAHLSTCVQIRNGGSSFYSPPHFFWVLLSIFFLGGEKAAYIIVLQPEKEKRGIK